MSWYGTFWYWIRGLYCYGMISVRYRYWFVRYRMERNCTHFIFFLQKFTAVDRGCRLLLAARRLRTAPLPLPFYRPPFPNPASHIIIAIYLLQYIFASTICLLISLLAAEACLDIRTRWRDHQSETSRRSLSLIQGYALKKNALRRKK